MHFRAVKNGMRVITTKQLEELMKSIGHFPSAEDLYDPSGDRCVSFPDFINIMIRKLNKMDSELLATFEMFDVNHNGFVSAKELQEVLHQLGEDVSEEDAVAMVGDADIDGDGLINIDEFQQKIFPVMQGLDNSIDNSAS